MTCILVTGHPRSGQSLIMQILNEVGIYIGEIDDIEVTNDDIDPAGIWFHKKVAGAIYYCEKMIPKLVDEFKSKSDVYAWKAPIVRPDIIGVIAQHDDVKVIVCYRNYRKIASKCREMFESEFGFSGDENDIIVGVFRYYYELMKFLKSGGYDYLEVNTEKIDVQQLARFIGVDDKRLDDAIKRVVKLEWL